MIENLPAHRAGMSSDLAAIMEQFSLITDIPRPSGEEGQMRQHLVKFAEERRLGYKLDSIGNIAIDVPATEGCADKPRVILQGHMDMVAEGGNHNKATRAIIQGDELKSVGEKTTLGADNGLGIAMGLVLAERALDKEQGIKHGPMTLLFTVDEEGNLKGVREMHPDILPRDKEVIVINLDAEEGPEYVCKGCAGGVDVEAEFDIGQREQVPAGYTVLEVKLSGLPGGHSGADIHRNHGNAIQILSELIDDVKLVSAVEVKIINFNGGTRKNVIPSAAEARIAVPDNKISLVKLFLENKVDKLISEGDERLRLSPEAAKKLKLEVTDIKSAEQINALRKDVWEQIYTAISDICSEPIDADPEEFMGGVKVSNSLGIAQDTGRALKLSTLARAADPAKLTERGEHLKEILERGGARVGLENRYDGWLEDERGRAIQTLIEAVRKSTGQAAQVFAYHAGLESAYVRNMLSREPERDVSAVAVGPRLTDVHSVREKASLSSTEGVFRVLVKTLERIAA